MQKIAIDGLRYIHNFNLILDLLPKPHSAILHIDGF